jgi:hypothetical protein
MRQRPTPDASGPPIEPRPSTTDVHPGSAPGVAPRAGRMRRRLGKGGIALATAVALATTVAGTALATTAVVTKNAGGITTVGPVNTEYGFPAWYQDKGGKRVELCLDGNDPMCGFVAAPVEGFDNTAPTVFPTNFPDEAFYMSAGSTLTLPNGGKATLTLGLEAAFLNAVQNGDQITFARQRIFVVGGPANTTLHFHQPYGDIDIDTDAAGKGRITEDIAPSVGNFDGVLKGNLGPFVTWDTGTVKTDSGEYLGDPAVPHKITAGPNGALFSVDYADATGAQHTEQTDFSLLGKIATNTGVKADAAVQTVAAGKTVVDVFATSEADAGELYVAADDAAGIATTPMVASDAPTGAKSFYARVAVDKTAPANITVKNIGDAPTSSSQVAVTKVSPITVTDASFDGTTLHVAAISANPADVLTVAGFDPANATLANGKVDIVTGAPPANVTVTNATEKASAPVRISSGTVTPPGEPPVPPGPSVDPVCTILDPGTGVEAPGPCPVGGPPAGTAPAPKVAPVAAPVALGDSVVLDASGTTNATSYEWTAVSGVGAAGGPGVTITNGATAKPTVKLTPYDVSRYTSATLPKAAQNAPAVVSVVAVNGTGTTAVRSAPVQVSIPVKNDTLGPLTTKFTAGKEYRIDGTSTVPGGSLVLNPPTSVAIYNTTSGKLVTTALVQVDTTGAWSFRPRAPFAATQDLARNITVVTSRGGYITGLVAGAPN